ncbi:hypothetical protein WICPIJ_002802 [Wickerhamomyces pijperi]|uniref:Large ribosomal subunit protein mL40 n=1 Tax=Wickerhamomyces pijperi TaxID=599730 RepID=A0A9P8TPH6_WICPI|nr:hypothetical protein WICPIJ_002802 [Wickerhamomyces pijperi]
MLTQTTQGSLKQPTLQLLRGLRTKSKNSRVATVSAATQRIITGLSVLSGRKKYPRILKLSNEDLIRHDTIQAAWAQYQRDIRTDRQSVLDKQYDSIINAMEDLKITNMELFKIANKKEKGKRFPLDARIPVDFPPNKVWHYEVKAPAEKK